MTTHSSILAWRIPRTEEPGEVQSDMAVQLTLRLSHLVPVKPRSLSYFFKIRNCEFLTDSGYSVLSLAELGLRRGTRLSPAAAAALCCGTWASRRRGSSLRSPGSGPRALQ